MKPQPNSKRSIKKRLEKEIRKMLPGMAVYIRRCVGYITFSPWGEWYTNESWNLFVGNKYWTKRKCEMDGCVCWYATADGLLQFLKEDIDKFVTIPNMK